MPLGILEAHGLEKVPGTTRYYDDPSQPQEASLDSATNLKYDESPSFFTVLIARVRQLMEVLHVSKRSAADKGAAAKRKDRAIIIIPQPSDDPNDPLNWPLWKRDLITFILCFAGILATALGAILASNTLVIYAYFSSTLSETAVLTGYYLLGAGVTAIFFVPSGRIWGKRHLFLVGIVFVIFSSVWAGATGRFKFEPNASHTQTQEQKDQYASMAAARAFQGIGTAPFESLLNAAVGDMYPVHKRGIRMAFTNLAVFGGAFLTPVVVGKITASIGWPWTFYLVAIFSAITFPAVFLFCPETAYRRDEKFNIDNAAEEEKLNPRAASPSATETTADNSSNEVARPAGFVLFPKSNAMQPIGNANTPKKTFTQSLSLFDGRKTDERYWVLLLRPFPLLMNPTFIWACLIQGTMIGWTIFIGVIIAIVFIGPPFFWGEEKAGYTYAGPFVGAVCGFLISGILADTSAKFLTKRNKGIYEPEFRLVLVIPMLIASGVGLYGFGLAANDLLAGKYSYYVPLVFFGFEVAGMVIGTVASSLYVVDAYRHLTVEAFTLMIIFKNIFSFILTWYAYDWLIVGGFRIVFLVISSIQIFICLLSIPMYIYGKRTRAFYHKHDVMDVSANFFLNIGRSIMKCFGR